MKLLVLIDIDGTCADPGDRFSSVPIPEPANRTNPEYVEYLKQVQTREKMLQDKPIYGMQKFVESLPHAVYLTARDEEHRKTTMDWLRMHNFPHLDLYMRESSDTQPSPQFKEGIIKTILAFGHHQNVIMVDDEDGMLAICERNNWTFLQAKSSKGKVK